MKKRKKKLPKILLDEFYPRPVLLLPLGPDEDGRFRLSDAVWFEVPGRLANTMIVMQQAWLLGRDQLSADRGWINAASMRELFISVLKKTLEVSTTQSYISLTYNSLSHQYEALGIEDLLPVEKLTGRGIHFTSPIDVRDSTGRLRLGGAGDAD